MKGSHKQYLKGLAHSLKPVVMIGHKGLTETLAATTHQALNDHELIKIKFLDFKEKAEKTQLISELEGRLKAECIGMIGHIAILFRRQTNPEKRRIFFPAES